MGLKGLGVLGFGVWGLELRVSESGALGSGLRVWVWTLRFGFKTRGFRLEFTVKDLGAQDLKPSTCRT